MATEASIIMVAIAIAIVIAIDPISKLELATADLRSHPAESDLGIQFTIEVVKIVHLAGDLLARSITRSIITFEGRNSALIVVVVAAQYSKRPLATDLVTTMVVEQVEVELELGCFTVSTSL